MIWMEDSCVGRLQRLMREPLHPHQNSATCVNLLKLPEYTNPENLRQKLLCAYPPSACSILPEIGANSRTPDLQTRSIRVPVSICPSRDLPSSACNASRLPVNDSLRIPSLWFGEEFWA